MIKKLKNWIRNKTIYETGLKSQRLINISKFHYFKLISLIKIGISKKLEDIAYFQLVKIDEFGGICRDNGFDYSLNI